MEVGLRETNNKGDKKWNVIRHRPWGKERLVYCSIWGRTSCNAENVGLSYRKNNNRGGVKWNVITHRHYGKERVIYWTIWAQTKLMKNICEWAKYRLTTQDIKMKCFYAQTVGKGSLEYCYILGLTMRERTPGVLQIWGRTRWNAENNGVGSGEINNRGEI